MARKTGMRISGDKDLIRTLSRIPVRLRIPVLVKSLTQGAKIIQRSARSLAPKDRGVLFRSIQVKTLPGAPAAVAIRPNYGRAPHAHLVEFGTTARFSTRNGVSRAHGRMPAQPFMGPAFRRNVKRANKIVGKLILKDVDRIAKQEAR